LAGNAVDQWNLDIAPSIYHDQSHNNGIDVAIDMSFPLAPIVGMTASFNEGFAFDDDFFGDDFIIGSLGAAVFVGHHDVGRAGLGLALGEITFLFEGDDYEDYSFNKTLVFGELYLHDFTLAASSVRIDFEDDFGNYKESEKLFAISYYPVDNIKLTVGSHNGAPSFALLTTGYDARSFEFEFQVASRISIFANYLRREADTMFFGKEVYTVGVSIYIRGGSSLKENDRWY
jgi:hypothetical protein